SSGSTETNGGGIIGGGQIGYNYQLDRIVLGLETDLQGSNVRSSASVVGLGQQSLTAVSAATTIEHDKNVEWLGTVRARVGALPWPSILVYATGGFAYGKTTADTFVSQSWTGPVIGPLLNSIGSVGHYSSVTPGWTIGAGFEWMLAPNLSLKAEYLYYNLGSAQFASTPLF